MPLVHVLLDGYHLQSKFPLHCVSEVPWLHEVIGAAAGIYLHFDCVVFQKHVGEFELQLLDDTNPRQNDVPLLHVLIEEFHLQSRLFWQEADVFNCVQVLLLVLLLSPPLHALPE